MKKRVLAGFLAMAMVSSLLAGCGSSSSEEEVMITPNEAMSSGLKWINSSIDGAIDESTDVRPEDDFYTAVNKDWLLETTVNDENSREFRILGSSMDKVTERLTFIMNGEDDPEAVGNVEIPEDNLEHVQSLIQTFAEAAGDWDRRNSEGASAIKKYIQYIEDIDSVDDLKAYFLDGEGQNLMALELLPLQVERSQKDFLSAEEDSKIQYLTVTNATPLSMQTLGAASDVTILYTGDFGQVISTESEIYKSLKKYFSAVMTGNGYTDSEAEAILKKCLKFECKLVDHAADSQDYISEWQGSDPITHADLEAMEGNYPLSELIEAYGYDTDEIIVEDPTYVKYIGSIINDSNLDQVKAWLTVNTVLNSMELLDWDTHELTVNADDEEDADASSASDDGSPDESPVESNDTPEQLQMQTLQSYLGSCLDMVYVARYCTTEEKEDITELINEIIDQYREMLREEDWMSEETQEQAVEKLDGMTVNVLYPDTFEEYDYLDFGDDTQLLDLVADINRQTRGSDADEIGKTPSDNRFPGQSTTEVNACYSSANNSINVLAGFIAGDTYDYSLSKEEKLARLGTVIGHEISHGFDDGGAKWDKNGKYVDWWAPMDELAFTEKVLNLQSYYSSITPYPGAEALKGTNLSREAIADMAGMKAVLKIAAEDEDFDYKEFFENYAMLFCEKDTFDTAERIISGDGHPLGCLRCNVTLSQFDEFLDTYGISKGDGMYTEAKDRILVW